MKDLSSIQTWELLDDLQASKDDIANCKLALQQGITEYSGGSVQERLDANKNFIETIEAELKRRE
jgi:hypothetical protein